MYMSTVNLIMTAINPLSIKCGCGECCLGEHLTTWSFSCILPTLDNVYTQAQFPFKRNRLRCVRCVCCVKFSRNKRKRQPIGILGRCSGNHDWLFANASACVSCGFRLRNARNACNASDCVWMETGLQSAGNRHCSYGGRLVANYDSFASVLMNNAYSQDSLTAELW